MINPAWANTFANPINPTIDRHPPPDEDQRYLVIGGTVGDDDGAGVGACEGTVGRGVAVFRT